MKVRRYLHLGGAVLLATALTALMLVPQAGAAVGSVADDDARTRDSIFISTNTEFNPANGVVSGSGTHHDPFVIAGWNVSDVTIQNTSKYVVIKDNVISGTLTADWIGNRLKMINNTIGDLRVNQNRERTGDMTSGVIAHNTFGVVGQLRHFDGVFAHNTVGSPDEMPLPFSEDRAVNFDGFNGAHFVHNTIYGYMDATLHGHHHSSGFGKKSHYHGTEPVAEEDEHAHHEAMAEEDHDHMDHTNRWHEVWIRGNKIYSSNLWALRYTDQNHAANDRTAASETNEELNLPHVHHTRIHMTGNKLFGSGLMVDIFNANDENHKRIAHGTVDIKQNQITIKPDLFGSGGFNGIDVSQAQHLTMRIVGNTVSLEKGDQADVLGQQREGTAGVFMNTLDVAQIYVFGNDIKDFAYGVRAANFTETVKWWVRGLKTTRVQDPLYYDNSVKSQPKTKH